jgi:HEAT repeat protein
MKIKNITEKLLYVGAIGISIFVLFFVITCSWIGYEIRNQCLSAKREYGGDCVEASISLLNDENRGFRARNDAIWVLGQLGNKQALPVLEEYYTGNIPEREPLDLSISQYELKKAINLTRGGFNIASLVWKIGFSEE